MRAEGNRVFTIFTAAGGYDFQREDAKKLLTLGEEYEIVGGELHESSSSFILEGFPGKHFNTCLFDADWRDAAHLLEDCSRYISFSELQKLIDGNTTSEEFI